MVITYLRVLQFDLPYLFNVKMQKMFKLVPFYKTNY